MLTYNDPSTVAVAGGPRHSRSIRSGKHAYVLSELASTIATLGYDAALGTLATPSPFAATTHRGLERAHRGASLRQVAVRLNRGENSLGLFSIDASAQPHAVAFEHNIIDTPRESTLEPAGRWWPSPATRPARRTCWCSVSRPRTGG